jgi:hypothetical protein
MTLLLSVVTLLLSGMTLLLSVVTLLLLVATLPSAVDAEAIGESSIGLVMI